MSLLPDPVRAQYEALPYPPIPWVALPHPSTGRLLRYERGCELALRPESHAGIRILIAGAGTFEPLVVAQQHPYAQEITAIDFSQSSIDRLKKRWRWSKLSPLRWGRRAHLTLQCADLWEWEPPRSYPTFDYILCSNVIHHVGDPAALLARLSAWLSPGGLLRIVTYPHQSRLWMRLTSLWLKTQSPAQARECISKLPPLHPLRTCFLAHAERKTLTGITDAFFHARENPLPPLKWAEAIQSANLEWIAEDQAFDSSSGYLEKKFPETHPLSNWERLQILDDLLEIQANPIFWLRKRDRSSKKGASISAESYFAPQQLPLHPESSLLSRLTPPAAVLAHWKQNAGTAFRLPSLVHWELRKGFSRAERRLASCGVSLQKALGELKDASDPLRTLPQHDVPEPWGQEEWDAFEQLADRDGLSPRIRSAPAAKNLSEQALMHQLLHFSSAPFFEICFDSGS